VPRNGPTNDLNFRLGIAELGGASVPTVTWAEPPHNTGFELTGTPNRPESKRRDASEAFIELAANA
jgi:hypothetical protein